MNIKYTLLTFLDIGVKKDQGKDIVFRIRILNLDAIMGILIPVIVLILHYTNVFPFNESLIYLLFSFPVVCLIALWFNSRYQYNLSSILILSYFLFVIPLLSFLLGEESRIHFLLIAVSVSGFIYFFETRYIAFLFFGAYMGMFVFLYLVDFNFFIERFYFAPTTMNFIGKACLVSFYLVLSYKMFGLVLIYEHILHSIRESESLFRNLYNYNPVGIAIADSRGHLLKTNPTFCELLGYKEEEMLGKSAADFSHEGDKERELAAAKGLWSGESDNYIIEKRFVRKNGETVWSNLSLAVIRNEKEEIEYAIGMVENISERKQQQRIIEENLQELNTKNEELEKYIESNMQLENFAYIASHDLKEPICSIQGLIELLDLSASEKLNEDEKQFISMLKMATSNMQKLIEDLLTYSRVNSQKFNFDIVNINSLLETIQFDLRAIMQEKKAVVEAKNMPSAITADPTKIRQLLQNLITNAMKFQQENKTPLIKISCEEKEREWIFKIEDNGIGIKPEFHEKIFLLFRRLHSRSEFEGTGIGLAICKKIVEQHGGNIWLDSEYGKGTTFSFSISKQLD